LKAIAVASGSAGQFDLKPASSRFRNSSSRCWRWEDVGG
jgi:hypothetical protein